MKLNDKVTFDLVDDEKSPGKKMAINVKGGTGPVMLSKEAFKASKVAVEAAKLEADARVVSLN